MIAYDVVDTPVGPLTVAVEGGALLAIRFAEEGPEEGWVRDASATQEARAQLSAWFEGRRRGFDLALAPGSGTPFQQRVWQALCALPWGATVTYGELARRLGRPGASRAVGAACGQNPLPIVVPCHRVVGAGGKLTGYAGGLARKRALLAMEGGAPPQVRGGISPATPPPGSTRSGRRRR